MSSKKRQGFAECAAQLVTNEATLKDAITSVRESAGTMTRLPTTFMRAEREIILIAQHGLSAVLDAISINAKVPYCWPDTARQALLADLIGGSLLQSASIELAPILDANHRMQTSTSLDVLGPPTGICFNCQAPLHLHNRPSAVKFVALHGEVLSKRKVTLRCTSCNTNYAFDRYGNSRNGYRFYDDQRDAVAASDSVILARDVFNLQWAFAQHSWVSFVGFCESWHDAFGISKVDGIDRRTLADGFWWGEVESEMRESNNLQYRFFCKGDRETFMWSVDQQRQQNVYVHPPEDCVAECKARGCGRLWVTDGIWKLQFPHCMFFVESKVAGNPLVNLPPICTNEAVPGHAFCRYHVQACENHRPPIATKLREFLQVSQDDLNVEDQSTKDESYPALDHSYATSTVDSISGQAFLQKFPDVAPIISSRCTETNPGCSKDLGVRTTLRTMSRGHQFVVRAGGHIDMWTPLFQSESPGQVFLFLVAWLYLTLKDIPPATWNHIFLAYDNMCGLLRMKAAQSDLPLPHPFSGMWKSVQKVIDTLHISNHVDTRCKEKLHPKLIAEFHKDIADSKNTQAAEQTFIWLGRYKKIIGSMSKTHHLFYLHRMVKRHNSYTARCYREGRKPILPGIRNKHST